VVALRDVSWSIEPGSRVCLLGPNGAGKSTSIRLLQGALRADQGEVSLLGAAVNGPGYLEARRRTGLVPQGPGMYPDLTAREMLRLARRLYGSGSEDAMATVFGLGDHLDKRLTALSGGYQRRLTLALALLSGPDLLLLDEPTVGLDPLAANEVQTYLRREMVNRTTLLCTHNLAEAEALCDQLIILRRGEVLVQGSIASLREQTAPRLRLRAAQGASALHAALLSARVAQSALTVDSDAVLVTVADEQAEAPAMLRGLLSAGIDVYECNVVRPTLTELFLELLEEDAA
jgi:ABC-2 type transport system ATP-binding protein